MSDGRCSTLAVHRTFFLGLMQGVQDWGFEVGVPEAVDHIAYPLGLSVCNWKFRFQSAAHQPP